MANGHVCWVVDLSGTWKCMIGYYLFGIHEWACNLIFG